MGNNDLKPIFKECDYRLASKTLINMFGGGVLKKELAALLDAFVSCPSFETAVELVKFAPELIVIFEECKPNGFYARYPNYCGDRRHQAP